MPFFACPAMFLGIVSSWGDGGMPDLLGDIMPVVFIHCPYSNPHPPQMGRVWVENNYPLKKWGG
jgi:hypothetical protein